MGLKNTRRGSRIQERVVKTRLGSSVGITWGGVGCLRYIGGVGWTREGWRNALPKNQKVYRKYVVNQEGDGKVTSTGVGVKTTRGVEGTVTMFKRRKQKIQIALSYNKMEGGEGQDRLGT